MRFCKKRSVLQSVSHNSTRAETVQVVIYYVALASNEYQGVTSY